MEYSASPGKRLGDKVEITARVARVSYSKVMVAYLILSPTCQIISILISSSSEYRLACPIITSMIHLLVCTILSILLSFAARYIPQGHVWNGMAPTSLSLVMESFLATACTFCEIRAVSYVQNDFWINVRALPLLFIGGMEYFWSSCPQRTLRFSVLVAIYASVSYHTDGGSLRGWAWGILWAMGAVMWGFILGFASLTHIREDILSPSFELGATPRQLINTSTYHFLFCFIFHIPALALSSEIYHFQYHGFSRFLNEPGFWGQEFGIAATGLANWILWRLLVTPSVNRPKPHSEEDRWYQISMAFVFSSLKDSVILPLAIHFLFGNSLGGNSPLSSRYGFPFVGVVAHLFIRAFVHS